MRKEGALASAIILALPPVFAQSGIDTVLSFFGNLFRAVFNPSTAGLAIFLKFVLVTLTFAVAYEKLPGQWRRGPKVLIALSLGLGAGLAIPTQLALSTGAFYGSFVVAVLILLPILFLLWVSYFSVKYSKTAWVYPGLILGWVVYFVLLAYFMAHLGTLPTSYEWVFTLASFLLIISPVAIIVLLGMYLGGEEQGRQVRISDLAKKWTHHEVKSNSKDAIKLIATAKGYAKAVKDTRPAEVNLQNIRRCINTLRSARNHVRVIVAQASKILATAKVRDPTDRDKLELAVGIQSDLEDLLSILPHILYEDDSKKIATFINDEKVVKTLEDFGKQIQAVSHLTTLH